MSVCTCAPPSSRRDSRVATVLRREQDLSLSRAAESALLDANTQSNQHKCARSADGAIQGTAPPANSTERVVSIVNLRPSVRNAVRSAQRISEQARSFAGKRRHCNASCAMCERIDKGRTICPCVRAYSPNQTQRLPRSPSRSNSTPTMTSVFVVLLTLWISVLHAQHSADAGVASATSTKSSTAPVPAAAPAPAPSSSPSPSSPSSSSLTSGPATRLAALQRFVFAQHTGGDTGRLARSHTRTQVDCNLSLTRSQFPSVALDRFAALTLQTAHSFAEVFFLLHQVRERLSDHRCRCLEHGHLVALHAHLVALHATSVP